MAKVYLSPAMHRQNECCYPRPDGKQCYEALENNEYIDILEPILNRCGIETKRGYRRTPMNNDNGDTIMRQNVAESNAWGADVHYVSHTNASSNGTAQGCHPMYYTYSKNGKKLGEIMAKYRREVYPRTVKLVARSDLYELRVPNAVSFYEEHAFHDNLEDITWFHTHMKAIAESAAKGLCEWFGLEYVEEPQEEEPEPTVERVGVSVRVLTKGMSGDDVRALQAALNAAGYDCGAADGILGAATLAAVKKFQSTNGLTADGVAGKDTWERLLGF